MVDDIVDNITRYWLTNTAVSSARIYWENKKYTFFAPKNVAIPVAVSAFPDEVLQTPRTRAVTSPEQPQLLSEEIRAAFRSLR